MSVLPLLPVAHMRRITPFFPVSRGLRRVDDRRVISGIIYVIRKRPARAAVIDQAAMR